MTDLDDALPTLFAVCFVFLLVLVMVSDALSPLTRVPVLAAILFPGKAVTLRWASSPPADGVHQGEVCNFAVTIENVGSDPVTSTISVSVGPDSRSDTVTLAPNIGTQLNYGFYMPASDVNVGVSATYAQDCALGSASLSMVVKALPPLPGQIAVINVKAFDYGKEVGATVSGTGRIRGDTFSGTTPFSKTLTAQWYDITITYSGITKTDTWYVVAGTQTFTIVFNPAPSPPPSGEPPRVEGYWYSGFSVHVIDSYDDPWTIWAIPHNIEGASVTLIGSATYKRISSQSGWAIWDVNNPESGLINTGIVSSSDTMKLQIGGKYRSEVAFSGYATSRASFEYVWVPLRATPSGAMEGGMGIAFEKDWTTLNVATMYNLVHAPSLEINMAPAYGEVKGKVIDETTGLGIAGVKIVKDGPIVVGLTGSDGSFDIKNVRPGTQTIWFTRFETATMEVARRFELSNFGTIDLGSIAMKHIGPLPEKIVPPKPGMAGVEGHVYDKSTGNPIAGALVVFSPHAVSTDMRQSTTSDTGYYGFTDLPPGAWDVMVGKEPEYHTLGLIVQLNEGLNTYDFTLEGGVPAPKKGALHVVTTPVNGEVYVDGIDLGKAPQSAELVVGDHLVQFGGVDGYKTPEEHWVTVYEEQTAEVLGTYVALSQEAPPTDSSKGRLIVETTPINADILINGVGAGRAPYDKEVEPGIYVIRFVPVDGYYTPQDRTVQVTAGNTFHAIGQYVRDSPPPSGGNPIKEFLDSIIAWILELMERLKGAFGIQARIVKAR